MKSCLGTSLLLRVLFTLLLSTRLTCGDWTLFVRADCWQGTGNDDEGASCDTLGDCDPQFVFCLRPYGTAGTNAEECPLGRVETGEFDSGDAFCFGDTYIDVPANVPNPIVFSNEGTYPGMFQLFVNVMDIDVSFHDLIANIIINLMLNPSESFTSLGTYGTGNGGSITLQFKVTCNTNHYGHNCTFCVDTDDNTGHFTCGSNGEKLCLTGWSGPTGNCTTPVCSDCHPIGGNCSAPEECTCQQGWSGVQCNQCQPKTGCVNGDCTSPGECICSTNWGGPLCDIDLIPCQTQSPCLNGGVCANNGADGYTCTCPSNYFGINCETPVTTSCDPNPCQNGGVCMVQNGMVICNGCQNGCSGSLCDDCSGSICDSSPCENGGSCQETSSGFECECPDGYTGALCDVTPCSLDPCINGSTCVNLKGKPLCACSTGSGDVCTKVCNLNPCLNGGQCSLTWDGSFTFSCTCLAGFTGSVCQLISATDPTNSMPTSSEESASGASSSDSGTLVAAIAGSVVLVTLIVIIVIVVVVACAFVRSKKQKPPITIDFSDLAQPPAHNEDMSSLNGQSVEVEKTDLTPPKYNDL